MRIFGKGKCKLIANFSATMVTSLPSLSLSLSLSLPLSLSVSLSLSHQKYLTHNIGSASALPIIPRFSRFLFFAERVKARPSQPCSGAAPSHARILTSKKSLFILPNVDRLRFNTVRSGRTPFCVLSQVSENSTARNRLKLLQHFFRRPARPGTYVQSLPV